jgi:hypothetical protein
MVPVRAFAKADFPKGTEAIFIAKNIVQSLHPLDTIRQYGFWIRYLPQKCYGFSLEEVHPASQWDEKNHILRTNRSPSFVGAFLFRTNLMRNGFLFIVGTRHTTPWCKVVCSKIINVKDALDDVVAANQSRGSSCSIKRHIVTARVECLVGQGQPMLC